MVADRKEDWPFTPSLLQVYVSDVKATLARAEKNGATIITTPTDFYGDILSRVKDPWNNMWWIYQHTEQEIDWSAARDEAAGADWSNEPTKELTYIHDTLLAGMSELRDK
jgi:hypothetical protein